MTPDVSNYADYYLRRLDQLAREALRSRRGRRERPRAPDPPAGRAMPACCDGASSSKLREAELDEAELASWSSTLADDIVARPKFADQDLDINIVRALLYLQRADPRIDQRVRQYLYGRPLTELSQAAVAALDPNTGDGRAFEIIESLGQLMWTVDRAALVFCIDQVEDLRFFDDAEERFQKAVARPHPDRQPRADLDRHHLLPGRLLRPGARRAGAVLHRPHREGRPGGAARDPHAGGGAPDHRQAPRARRPRRAPAASSYPDASAFFGPQFFEEFGGLSTRRLLEHAQSRLRSEQDERRRTSGARPRRRPGFISTLAAALGFAPSNDDVDDAEPALDIDFRELWSASSRHRRPRSRRRQRPDGRAGRRRSELCARRMGRRGHSFSIEAAGAGRRPAGARSHGRHADGLRLRGAASSCATGRPRAAASSVSSTGC